MAARRDRPALNKAILALYCRARSQRVPDAGAIGKIPRRDRAASCCGRAFIVYGHTP